MFEPVSEPPSMAGSLLLADPELPDPHFRRTVVLISSHSAEDGAMGVILNRPTGECLADLDPHLVYDKLGDVPVYEGGPVQADQILLGAWSWTGEAHVFRLFLGIDADKARELQGQENTLVRAFKGYSGWGKGQMEAEIEVRSWTVATITPDVFGHLEGVPLWKELIRQVHPEWTLRIERPERPDLN